MLDKTVEMITKSCKNILPEGLKTLIKKFYNPYKVLPCRFGESLMKPERLQFLLSLLQEQVDKKIDGDVIECGVFRGGSVAQMGLKLKRLNSNKVVHGIDTFEGHPFSTKEDISEDGEIHSIRYNLRGGYNYKTFHLVKKAVRKLGADNVILYKGRFDQVFPRLKNKKFCFANIDCDTYLSTKHCIEFLKPRMAKGSVIYFDDYNGFDTVGETKAVNEFLKKENIVKIGDLGCYYKVN